MRTLIAGIVILLAAKPIASQAFELSGPTWFNGQTTFFVNIPGTAPNGESWNAAFNRALNAWTNETAFTYFVENQYRDPCSGQNTADLGDRISGVDFASTQCGSAFGENVLAITLESFLCSDNDCTGPKEYIETDIIFNDNINWDIYNGAHRNDIEDFERVALHELGHALGLNHEFFADAIMAPFAGDIATLQEDDINGANLLYGESTTTPSIYGIAIQIPNDRIFSSASSSKQFTGALEPADAEFDGKFLDIHQVTFANDSSVTIDMASNEFDASLILARIDSVQQLFPDQLFTDDNSGVSSNARIEQTLSAGTYWIGATSSTNAAQGSYTLDISSEALGTNSALETFTSVYGIEVEINPNPVIFERLGAGDEQFENKFVDLYQLQVVTPIELNINVESNQFDTRMFLAQVLENQQFGSLLIENDDGGNGTNSRIQAELDPGTYWIAVTSFANNEVGDYEVNIAVVID